MNIFKQIAIANKIKKIIKEVDKRTELSAQIKKSVENIKTEIDTIAKLAPEVKELIADINKAIK